jgi:hypothetical protein
MSNLSGPISPTAELRVTARGKLSVCTRQEKYRREKGEGVCLFVR